MLSETSPRSPVRHRSRLELHMDVHRPMAIMQVEAGKLLITSRRTRRPRPPRSGSSSRSARRVSHERKVPLERARAAFRAPRLPDSTTADSRTDLLNVADLSVAHGRVRAVRNAEPSSRCRRAGHHRRSQWRWQELALGRDHWMGQRHGQRHSRRHGARRHATRTDRPSRCQSCARGAAHLW